MAPLLPENWLNLDPESIAQLAPIQWLKWPELEACGVTVGIKREDLLHPVLGGNKFYKLYYHLQHVRAVGADHVLTFGGAWSNHLYALAAAGQVLGIRTTGVVRGDRPSTLSAMLQDAIEMGMQLHFVSRDSYRQKSDPVFLAQLRERLGPFYAIPEGAGDRTGALGCTAFGRGLKALQVSHKFDTVCCAVGTGGTVAGLSAGLGAESSMNRERGKETSFAPRVCDKLPQNVTVCGFSVLKGLGALNADINRLLESLPDASASAAWHLETDYHCGGYARLPEQLAQFMLQFEKEMAVPLDPVYTAKLMWGIRHKALAGHWRPGTCVLAIHTGGLQGRRGFECLPPLDSRAELPFEAPLADTHKS